MGTEHWVGTALSDVVKSRKGKKPRVLGNEPFKNSAAYINIAAFERGIIDEYADIASSNLCKSTDILVVWDGARFGLAGSNQEGAIGSTLAALSPILWNPTTF